MAGLEGGIIAKLLWHLPGLSVLRLWGFDTAQHHDGGMSLRDAITSLPELRVLQLRGCPALADHFV